LAESLVLLMGKVYMGAWIYFYFKLNVNADFIRLDLKFLEEIVVIGCWIQKSLVLLWLFGCIGWKYISIHGRSNLGAHICFQFQLNASADLYPTRVGVSRGNCCHMLLNTKIARSPLVL
jgi:hypothetical protein